MEFPRSGVQFLENDKKKTQTKARLFESVLAEDFSVFVLPNRYLPPLTQNCLTSMISYVPMFWIDSYEQCLTQLTI